MGALSQDPLKEGEARGNLNTEMTLPQGVGDLPGARRCPQKAKQDAGRGGDESEG